MNHAFLSAACREARRARGSVAPNPLVGAVLVRGDEVLASAHHAFAGALHAEAAALAACADPAGATLYVTLEPCAHTGRQPPCVDAIVRSNVKRVVVGARDPNPRTAGAGVAALRAAGIAVDVLDDPACLRLIEDFAVWITADRPYVALKMAASLDGFVSPRPDTLHRLTGPAWAERLRDLRIEHDAVLVGAGTVRVDDPRLTVRPSHARVRPYVRVVACAGGSVPASSRVFAPVEGYARTVVLAPGGSTARCAGLEAVADVVYVGDAQTQRLDLGDALRALRLREIYSVLCEGGPRLAARAIADGLVDRFYWAIAPTFLSGEAPAGVLAGADLAQSGRKAHFDGLEQVGEDALLSGRFDV